ncbi:MAG: DNA repair protein RecO, partial [Bacteroidota bacterium]|nr:DNA repair protein RecO [Bacteroidota bacterium]
MIEKTSGIVLKIFPFKESSSIVAIYTEKWGLKSFIIKGGRKKNAKVRSVLFRPLQIIDIETYINKKSTLSLISDVSLCENLDHIYGEMTRTSLAFFLTEVIQLSLQEDAPDEHLFKFLYDIVLKLNNIEKKELKDFHLHFMYYFA